MVSRIIIYTFLLLLICCSSISNRQSIKLTQSYLDEPIFFLSNPYYEDSVKIFLPKIVELDFNKNIKSSIIQYFENRRLLIRLKEYYFFEKENREFFPTSEIKFDKNYNLDLLLYKNINISYDDLNKILENNNLAKKEKGFRDTVFIGDINNFKKDNPLFFEKLNSKNDSLFIYYVEKGKSKFELEKFRINW